MARHIEPVCRLCRREGEKLFLKGSRCLSGKCAFERRSFIPGQHGPNLKAKRAKTSDYGVQLREKQKLRRIYGVLEHQFERYYNRALKSRGVTGAELLILLERRLDNVIYRAGFALSRSRAAVGESRALHRKWQSGGCGLVSGKSRRQDRRAR